MATKDFKIRHSLTVSENATIEGNLTLGGKTVSRLIDSDEVTTIINNSSSGFDSDQVVAIINENTSPDIVARLDSDEIKIQAINTELTGLELEILGVDASLNAKIDSDSARIDALAAAGVGLTTFAQVVHTFTTTQPTTIFTGADDDGDTLSYTVGKLQVYLNGLLLTPGASKDYTATNGTSVVLTEASDSEDVITIVKYLGAADDILTQKYVYKVASSGDHTPFDSEFTGADENGNVLSYTPNKVQVFLNGILLQDSDDYIANNGSTITLLAAPDSDDVLVVYRYLGTQVTGFDSDQVVAIINENLPVDQTGFDSDQVVAIINENLPVDQTGFDSDQVVAIINENSSGGGGAFTIDADDNMISSNSSASPTAGSGLRNIIAGTGAGTSITTSDDNIMLGTNSGSNVTTGFQNTLVGHMGTAHTLVSGQKNTLVGYEAGIYATGNYNTVVGSNIGGDGGNANTSIGYSCTWQLDSNYNATIGASNYSQGARTYAGGFVTGASAGYCVTVGSSITNSGQNGIAIGREAATSGGDQIAIGTQAGTNNPVYASSGSVSIGFQSGRDNEADNTVNIGYKAGMNFSPTANYNVNIGYEVASYTGFNPNSQYCVNIGYRAGLYAQGDRNIAIGANTNGNTNTAASARDNVCVGHNAGRVLTSGFENVFIGSNSDQSCLTGNANVIIGSTTNVSVSNAVGQVVLGYGLNGQGNNTFRVKANSGSYNTQNSSVWTTTSDERIKTNVTEYTLGLDTLNQINVKTYNYLSDSDIAAAHPELADSDGLVHEGLDTEKTIVGLMAQELEVVLPNSVTTRDNGIKAVNKDELFWVMLNSIKELKAANDSLVARVEALENA